MASNAHATSSVSEQQAFNTRPVSSISEQLAPNTHPASYVSGHHASVLASHAQRTASTSAAYLLPHINVLSAAQPHIRILDVGCGPGSITVDLAARYPSAEVIGVETAAGASALDAARELAKERGVSNVKFVIGDIHSLVDKLDERPKTTSGKTASGKAKEGEGDQGPETPTPTRFTPGSFDVVHAHQVLQHCGDPVSALRQMRLVCRSRGCVAVRTADLGTVSFHPPTPSDSYDDRGQAQVHPIKEWQRLFLAVMFAQGGEPRAGRMQHAWARAAGFDAKKIKKTWGTQSWGDTPEQVSAEAEKYAERIVKSGFKDSAIKHGLASEQELESVAEGTRRWGKGEDAWLGILNGEMVCFV